MELKTESGVSITILEEGSSKVLIFSKAVRAIGLNKKEISKISSLLTLKPNASKAPINIEPLKSKISKKATSGGH